MYPNLENSRVGNIGWGMVKFIENPTLCDGMVDENAGLIIMMPSFYPSSPDMGPLEPAQEVWIHGRESIHKLWELLGEWLGENDGA